MGIKEELEKRFLEKNVKVTLFPETAIKEFASLQEFQEFINKERDYWSECNNGKCSEIFQQFKQIADQLQSSFNQNDNHQAFNHLDNACRSATQNKFPTVYSVTAVAKLIKEKFKEKPEYADGICQFLFEEAGLSPNNRQLFMGYMYAFLFSKFEGAMSSKIGAENASLADLKTRYVEELNTLHSEYCARDKDCIDKTSTMEGKYAELREEMKKWKEGVQQNVNDILTQSIRELGELTALHREKLRMEGPATYWNTLAKNYKKWGYIWTVGVVMVSSISLGFLTYVIAHLPEIFTTEKQFGVNGLQSTLMLTFIASIIVYVVHFSVKMALSSFHMSRDAREREQLTHVFLSLMKDGMVDTNERAIVLQSIFSRTDTGLIKGDGGPTLPGVFGGIIRNVGGK